METPTHVFSYEYCQIFKNTCFTEHVRWLLLKVLRTPLYFLLTVALVSEATYRHYVLVKYIFI